MVPGLFFEIVVTREKKHRDTKSVQIKIKIQQNKNINLRSGKQFEDGLSPRSFSVADGQKSTREEKREYKFFFVFIVVQFVYFSFTNLSKH